MRDKHGILNPQNGAAHFALTRHAPSPDLAGLVQRYWVVRWDLQTPYEQETLPFPAVNLVVGTHRPGLHGVCTTRFVARLEGSGWVIGVKFRPGGFRPFTDGPVFRLTDREIPVASGFDDGAALERDIENAIDDEARVGCMETFLRARGAVHDADARLADKIVTLVQDEPAIARVADLAERAGSTVRSLERLFREYVGVSPKWVIRRFRAQEAAARVAQGLTMDWTALALDLGYFDQAHFVRDFKAQIGRTPVEYAAWCALARAPQRRRNVPGGMPVQRLNARPNEARSAKPSR